MFPPSRSTSDANVRRTFSWSLTRLRIACHASEPGHSRWSLLKREALVLAMPAAISAVIAAAPIAIPWRRHDHHRWRHADGRGTVVAIAVAVAVAGIKRQDHAAGQGGRTGNQRAQDQ